MKYLTLTLILSIIQAYYFNFYGIIPIIKRILFNPKYANIKYCIHWIGLTIITHSGYAFYFIGGKILPSMIIKIHNLFSKVFTIFVEVI